MTRANLRWPVFAELDRRLYVSSDIHSLDVLRIVPPGFLYGVGPNSPLPPGDTQEIGLTVAGVAACPGGSEILSVFVEFIQMAVAVEKAWLPPPDDPATLPTLTAADFAAGSLTLPSADQGQLLRLLFLIIKAERSGWAGLSSDQGTGQWAVSLSRSIRDFADVRDIDDYWSRRPKPWESGPPAPGPAPRDADGAGPRIDGASGLQLGSGNVQYNYFYASPLSTGSGGPRPTPAAGAPVSPSPARGHAFLSYVREDSDEVDALQKLLEAAGIPVWRDTSDLWPGEDWRIKIRRAINRDALVFIACFSGRGMARTRSYQNEELVLAIDELRRRRPGDPWLFPVRFDDCDIPDYELGAGRTLASLQRADLFGANRDLAAQRLVAAVQRILR